MLWTKHCTKCGGDLYTREELDAWEIVCAQCSRVTHFKAKPGWRVSFAPRPALQPVPVTQPVVGDKAA